MTAYYNEIDPYAAQWLRNLIAGGHITPGDVDERSITDVRADDLTGYTQVHFFAGIGGWSLALRLAGWPDDRPVWTGSCPCQPFSAAGKGAGFADERHLWPAFFRLIRELRPSVVLGEQVASPLGREWLARVRSDLEGAGFAVGAADLCAAGVGAPHSRQRHYFVGLDDARGVRSAAGISGSQPGEAGLTGQPLDAGGLDAWGVYDILHGEEGSYRRAERGTRPVAARVPGRVGRLRAGQEPATPVPPPQGSRVGRLRGYGNAVVPQLAAAFVRAVM